MWGNALLTRLVVFKKNHIRELYLQAAIENKSFKASQLFSISADGELTPVDVSLDLWIENTHTREGIPVA